MILMKSFSMVEEHCKIHLDVELRASMYPILSKYRENTRLRWITGIPCHAIELVHNTTILDREYGLLGEIDAYTFHLELPG